MSEAPSPWTIFLSGLTDAKEAASQGRFGDLMTLAARLEQSAAALPPPSETELSRIRQQVSDLSGVLAHVNAVKGALTGLRADLADAYGPSVDQRG